ncbi:MAG TPA: response regulator transcription factor [Terriglobales bacterium]|nr:response regulator transcription factor [Terriglobales bacterium]
MAKERKTKVLLVEDHALVRRGFRRLLADEPDIEVVGDVGDGAEAVSFAQATVPDVIVMDCALPGMDGFAATQAILRRLPKTIVLMLSMHAEGAWVRRAFEAGASGYILKSAADLDLAEAVRKVAAGERLVDPRVEQEQSSLKGDRRRELTKRELEVLQLIAEGNSNKEIATKLGLSVNTVAVHRANIMDALGIHKTAELVVYAIRSGIVNVT